MSLSADVLEIFAEAQCLGRREFFGRGSFFPARLDAGDEDELAREILAEEERLAELARRKRVAALRERLRREQEPEGLRRPRSSAAVDEDVLRRVRAGERLLSRAMRTVPGSSVYRHGVARRLEERGLVRLGKDERGRWVVEAVG